MNKLRKKIAHITGIKKNKEISIHTKTGSAIASTCARLLPIHSIIRSSRQCNTRIVQNFLLIWLDNNLDEHYCRHIVTILQHIINTVHIFTKVDECIEFIRDIKEEKIFMIVSGTFGQTTMPIVHNMLQVDSIYIFCENKLEHELWVHKWSKIKGVFMEILFLCEALEQATQECDQNTIPMSFIEMNDGTSNQNLDKLNQSFMYTQILMEIVSTINFKQQDIKEFITYYRKQIVGNVIEQKNIDTLEREYHDHGPIWWYTHPCFIYSVLNRALRTMEIDTLIKMGFFLYDLHQHISRLHFIQNAGRHDSTSFIVYRGQGMSQTDFDQLKKTEGGLLSFNNFLFTSKNRQISLDFAYQTITNSDLIGILFVMTIDPLVASSPFVNIHDISCVLIEEEILFSINSVFRIGHIKQISNRNDRLWQVELILTSNNDPELLTLTEYIREETFPHRKGWCRWSELLIKQGQLNKAQQICDTVITQTSDVNEKGFLYYQLGLIKFRQGEYLEANSFYNLSLEIRQKTLPTEHIDVAACYNEIGLVYEKIDQYSKALSSLEKAFEIYEKTLPPNDPLLATCNNNIGRVLCQIGEYSKSILCYEKALEIYLNTLPSNHSNIVAAYINIGSVHENMGEYEKAISSFEKIIAIYKQNLPPNHLDMANLYAHIGSVYEKMSEYSIAISYYETAIEIYEENLLSNHSDLAVLHNNIGLVYFQRGDHFKALSFLEKAHKIYRKIFPSNHPNLAASYTCQGAVYEEIGQYIKAFLYYKKAFKIYRNIHPLNHLDLATSYNNIGSVYFQTGEYPTALSCHEKALEIYQKYLPSNHPDLANSYSWHGDLYDKMGDHLKALSFYKYALDIGQQSLPENHPSIQQWKDNIEMIKRNYE
jgi:tetratricopeptide (TPR) repeat protein